ncbi:MAG: ATP-binding cassette domain-containing protein, partial [Betaproteobacteria bacterium]
MASVTLSGVRKSFGSAEVVHGVDIEVEDGEFCVLVGPSGCGKSTLLRMIAGLEEISGGRIAIGERVVNGVAPKERDIAMVFQNYALYPHMSVYDNMAFSLKLAGESREETRVRVEEAALILGLMDYLRRYPRQLSGGQRQRVAMRTEIKALHQRLKTTSVYVTHDQIEAMTMADKIVVMNSGRVEQTGSPLDLYDDPANQFVAGFIGSPAMNFLSGRMARNGAGLAVAVGGGVHLPMPTRSGVAEGRDVVVGVRPEHFAVAEDGVPAEVVVVEPTGADTQIFCKLAGRDVTAVVRERHAFQPGAAVRLKPQHTFLFDPASGNRL